MKIPLFKIYWDEDDVRAVNEVIRSGMYWTTGPKSKEFERMIAEYLGRKYAVVFNSGTSALHAAVLAHRIKGWRGDCSFVHVHSNIKRPSDGGYQTGFCRYRRENLWPRS